jgi:hypothetical protein
VVCHVGVPGTLNGERSILGFDVVLPGDCLTLRKWLPVRTRTNGNILSATEHTSTVHSVRAEVSDGSGADCLNGSHESHQSDQEKGKLESEHFDRALLPWLVFIRGSGQKYIPASRVVECVEAVVFVYGFELS